MHKLFVVHLDAVFVETGEAVDLTSETRALVATLLVHFVATLFHHIQALLLATNFGKGGLIAKRRLSERVPAITALEGDFEFLGILAIQTFVIGLFLAGSAEVFCAARTAASVISAVLRSLFGHLLVGVGILGIVVRFGWLEGKDFVAARALHDVVAKEKTRLFVTDFLKHHLAEILAKILRRHQRVAFAAATVSEVTRWKLREQGLLGVRLEAVQVELMVAAVGKEHTNLVGLLLLLGELCKAVNARWHIFESRHVKIFLFLLLIGLVLRCRCPPTPSFH